MKLGTLQSAELTAMRESSSAGSKRPEEGVCWLWDIRQGSWQEVNPSWPQWNGRCPPEKIWAMVHKKRSPWDFPGGPMSKIVLPIQIRSLVRELRCCMLHCRARKSLWRLLDAHLSQYKQQSLEEGQTWWGARKMVWLPHAQEASTKGPFMTSPAVQWLRLHAPNAGGLSSIPGQETRSHMLELRVHILQLRPGLVKYISKNNLFFFFKEEGPPLKD